MTIQLHPTRPTFAVFFNLYTPSPGNPADVLVYPWVHEVITPPDMGQYMRDKPHHLRNLQLHFEGTGHPLLGAEVIFCRTSPVDHDTRRPVQVSSFFLPTDFQTSRIQVPVDEILDGFTYVGLWFPPGNGKVTATFWCSPNRQGQQLVHFKSRPSTESDADKWVMSMETVFLRLLAFYDPEDMVRAIRQLGREDGTLAFMVPELADQMRTVTRVRPVPPKDSDNQPEQPDEPDES